MAYFIVRVELHGERDYTKLHEAMERFGFSRNIKGSDGKHYRLPNWPIPSGIDETEPTEGFAEGKAGCRHDSQTCRNNGDRRANSLERSRRN